MTRATRPPAADTHRRIPLGNWKGCALERLRRCALGVAVVGTTLLALPAGASSVLVNFSAILTSVSDPRGLLPATLSPGTSLTGTLSYAWDASCDPVLPTTCEYIASPSGLALWMGTAPIASIAGRAYLFVEDGPIVDSFSASVGAPAGPSGGSDPDWLSGDVQLSDPGATALGGTGLPTTLRLSDFSQHTFDAGGCYGGACTGDPSDQFQIAGTILSMQPAPEPESPTLLALGLLALGGSRSCRARRSGRLACSATKV